MNQKLQESVHVVELRSLFFDNKNTEVLEYAQYLIDFMWYFGDKGQRVFYHEILERNDKFYSTFLQYFHRLLHLTVEGDEALIESKIKATEESIKKLNNLIDSEEDKNENYLSYYSFLLQQCPDRLKIKNVKYMESKILDINPDSQEAQKVKSVLKQKESEKRKSIFGIFNSFVLAVLSFVGGKYIYKIADGDEIANVILVCLAIANLLSVFMSIKLFSSRGKKTWLIVIKTLIILTLVFFLFGFIYQAFILE